MPLSTASFAVRCQGSGGSTKELSSGTILALNAVYATSEAIDREGTNGHRPISAQALYSSLESAGLGIGVAEVVYAPVNSCLGTESLILLVGEGCSALVAVLLRLGKLSENVHGVRIGEDVRVVVKKTRSLIRYYSILLMTHL